MAKTIYIMLICFMLGFAATASAQEEAQERGFFSRPFAGSFFPKKNRTKMPLFNLAKNMTPKLPLLNLGKNSNGGNGKCGQCGSEGPFGKRCAPSPQPISFVFCEVNAVPCTEALCLQTLGTRPSISINGVTVPSTTVNASCAQPNDKITAINGIDNDAICGGDLKLCECALSCCGL